jgi:ADP-glucose pyrophosphorylase
VTGRACRYGLLTSCKAILDKNVRIPQDATIGYDLDADRERGWHMTESGIVAIGPEYSTMAVVARFV